MIISFKLVKYRLFRYISFNFFIFERAAIMQSKLTVVGAAGHMGKRVLSICIDEQSFEIIAAIELRRHIVDEIWLLMLGIISILFGIVIFVNPLISAIAISVVIGVYAILFGIFLAALAITVKPYTSKSRRR